jgi:hypothetical protein
MVKIGQPENFKLIDHDKLMQLKIGKGQPETFNPLKY